LGLLQYNHQNEIEVEVEYEEPYRGFNLSDVIDDGGDFDVIEYIKKYKQAKKAYPLYIPVATLNTSRISEALNNNSGLCFDEFQGLDGVSFGYQENRHITVIFNYRYDPVQLYNMEIAAQSEADKLVKYLYGKDKIPPFLKVFLVFSYIQQSVKYDTMYIDGLKRGMKNMDISSELPFCVLGSASKRAISKGIAKAFKLIMDKSEIECQIVRGMLNITGGEDEYYWNIVKLNGMYYHMDASWHIDNKGINVSRFMCNDHVFFTDHGWYEGTPSAKGRTYNYDYIEEHINENLNKLIASGIEEKYLTPDEVYC
jgi:hypothetical protein